MEYERPIKNFQKVNLTLNNQNHIKILKVEKNKYIGKTDLAKRKEVINLKKGKKMNITANNGNYIKKYFDENNETQNLSQKINHININNENFGNNDKDLFKQINSKNNIYIYNSNIKNDITKKLKKQNAKNIINFNENNSTFNQIISGFKKFSENYEIFVKHMNKSNTFKNASKNKENKSINDNNEMEKSEYETLKLIRVNHMNGIKKKEIKNNYIQNSSRNKFDIKKKLKIINNESKENNKILVSDDLSSNYEILNKDIIRKNITDKIIKSKEKNIKHDKNNLSMNYNDTKTISYIPINFRVNSEKRSFIKKSLYKDNLRKNENIKTNKFFHKPKEINNRIDIMLNNTISVFNNYKIFKKLNRNNEINNNSTSKKKNEKINNGQFNFNNKNKNSLFYNTKTSINSICLPKRKKSDEYNNILINNLSQSRDNILLNNEYSPKIEVKTINRLSEFIKVRENIDMNNSLYESRANQVHNNDIPKFGLYAKPLKSSTKSKKILVNYSPKKFLYKKKIHKNILNSLNRKKINNSIDLNNNFNYEINKKSFIKKKLVNKKFNINKINCQEKNENKNCENKKTSDNISSNSELNISYSLIQKNHIFCRYKKYYSHFLKVPIKTICFIEKIKSNKHQVNYENNSNNDVNVNSKLNGNIIVQNQDKILLSGIKNGIDYYINNSDYKAAEREKYIDFFANEQNYNTIFKEKNNSKKKGKSTEKKFALGCKKLNRILLKKSNLNDMFNGIEIEINHLKSEPKNKLLENGEKNMEIFNNSDNTNENGCPEKEFKNIYKIQQNSKLIKDNNKWNRSFKKFLEKDDTSGIIISNNNNNDYGNKLLENKIYKNELDENAENINFKNINKNRSKSKSKSTKQFNETVEKTKNNISDKDIYELIEKDLENYLKFLDERKNEEDNIELYCEYNWKIIDNLMTNGKIKLEEIIKIYTDICKNKKLSKDEISKVNNYIKSIIEYYISDFSKTEIKNIRSNMIELFKLIINLNQSLSEIYLEILGNLLFILLKNKLYYMKDLNYFIESTKEIQINIAKIVKYCILSSGKCTKQYHNDFKYTKLFNNNELFINCVTKELPEFKEV